MAAIKVKRTYASAEVSDGYRVLVDRLWPRGIRKEDAHIDVWLKEVAPSTELRKWFHAHLDQWEAFSKRYAAELKAGEGFLALKALAGKHAHITLLYASRDEEHNHALLLAKWLVTGVPAP